MIIHPLQNTASKILGGFMQVRPRMTQDFDGRPEYYSRYGLKSHGAWDFGPNGNETIFAPFSGEIKVKDDGEVGYGLHIKIRDGQKECVLGHLREVFVVDGQSVKLGDKLALMGNTGDSTAKHLHFGLRFTENDGPLWSRRVLNYDNGWHGYVDPTPYVITWKGTQKLTDL